MEAPVAAIDRLDWPTRLLAAGTLGLAIAVPLVGPSARFTVVVAALACAAALGWHVWDQRYGRSALLRALTAHWAELHGAGALGNEVTVYDGTQLLQVRLAGRRGALTAAIRVRLPGQTLAFKLWPTGGDAPSYDGTGSSAGGPEIARSPGLEQLFVGLFRVDTNDARGLRQVIDEAFTAALLEVRRAGGDTFAGVTFDGEHLGIHWRGAGVSNPERTLQLSRPLWRALLP